MRETINQMMQSTDIASGTKPKRVANNTVKYTHADGSTRWRLHHTDVVSLKDGIYTLNSGGWRTPTTKERINNYAPVRLYANKGNWHLGDWRTSAIVFYDGMRVDASGSPVDVAPVSDIAAKDKLRKRITKFCQLVTTVDTLPVPDNGDCWFCSMRDIKTGKTMGDGNTDHLMSHIDENYLHGSLLVNAMREAGYNDSQIRFNYQLNCRDTFRRKLRVYLQKRLVARMAPDINEKRFSD